MVEQEVALAVEHVIDGGGDDLVVVAPVPAIPVLADVRGVVAGLDGANMVDHGEQGVCVAAERVTTVLSCVLIKNPQLTKT